MNDGQIMSFVCGVARLIRDTFDRARVRKRIPEIVARREPRMGVSVRDWRIRRMKTRWDTCTPEAVRICLSSGLAKKPPLRLESVVVQETPYLIDRRHNERFRTILDRIIPVWQLRLDQLNRAHFPDEDWGEIPSSPSGVPR